MKNLFERISLRLFLLSCFFIFVNSGILFAFEDPRWEGRTSVKVGEKMKKQQIVPKAPAQPDVRTQVELERDKKTLEMLKESPTPIRTPDTILRVLFLPYTDEAGVLRTSNYVFLKIEDGKWIIGDYLMPSSTSFRKKTTLTPLEFTTSAEAESKEPKKETKKESRKEGEGGEIVDPIH